MTIEVGINQLVKSAEGKGWVTYDDFNETFPDRFFSPDQLDEACIKLRTRDVDIRDVAIEP